jgi:hypothetical protein
MRILKKVLTVLAVVFVFSANASSPVTFEGQIVAINGTVISVQQSTSNIILFVKLKNGQLNSEDVGILVSGTCVMRGDLCHADNINMGVTQ